MVRLIIYLSLALVIICALPGDAFAKRGSKNRGQSTNGGWFSGSTHHNNRGGGQYPPSDGLSGSGHKYPPSNGLSGSGNTIGGNNYNPNNFGSNYNPNIGHNYPNSNGLSGYGRNTNNMYGNKNNYHYSPPQQIHYTPYHGGAPQHYPVYRGPPPVYVDRIRNSNSRYTKLLTGLALLNLGLTGATLLSHSRGSSHHVPPETVCTFRIEDGPNIEMTKIPCNIISSYMEDEKIENSRTNTESDINDPAVNGTEPVDATLINGPEIQVNPTMKCSVQMRGPVRSFTHQVDCRLLEEYARQSYRLNSATKFCNAITTVIFMTVLAFLS